MRANAADCTFGNQELLIRYYTEMEAGARGFDIISDTSVHTRNYTKLVSLSDSTKIVNATFYPVYSGNWNSGLSAVTLPKLTELKGDFMTVQLTAGAVIAYFMTPDTVV